METDTEEQEENYKKKQNKCTNHTKSRNKYQKYRNKKCKINI